MRRRVIPRGESLPGPHEPLVNEVTFACAQKLLRSVEKICRCGRGSPTDYLLLG